MSERLLLLSSAKTGVIVHTNAISQWWFRAALVLGSIVVFVGMADLLLKASQYVNDRVPSSALQPLGTLTFPPATVRAQAPSPFVPTRLRISALGINAPVEAVALKADNKTMASPKKFSDVAWYSPGRKPGEAGNTVFAGHLNSPTLGVAGVFNTLSKATVGDVVAVEGAKGEKLLYGITSVKEYVTAAAPAAEIFTQEGPSQIILITCEGNWDQNSKTFDKRLVVVARLLPM